MHKQLLTATVAVTVTCTNNKMYAPYYYRYILIFLPSHFLFSLTFFSVLWTTSFVVILFPRVPWWNQMNAWTQSANRKILSDNNALGFATVFDVHQTHYSSTYYVHLIQFGFFVLFYTNHCASLGNTVYRSFIFQAYFFIFSSYWILYAQCARVYSSSSHSQAHRHEI